MKFLTRNDFRELVFTRDEHKCVICRAPGQDAHHIIERRLFSDGGYYLDNGATVCGPCHILAEQTILDAQVIREETGISRIVLPEHLYSDVAYDKWANIIQPNGRRLKGELFFDESVQKVLKEGDVLHLFDQYVKYPRTYHLPWSPGINDDDRVLKDFNGFMGQEVIVTLKVDGENSTLYPDYMHARSISYTSHLSRTWLKNMHAKIGHDIPPGFRICGENLFAKHSIHYTDLSTFFMVFSIWNDHNICLSWNETCEYAGLLGLEMVPSIWRGVFNEQHIQAAFEPYKHTHEGYVVRVANAFSYGAFRYSIAKYVRANHVDASAHNWAAQRVVPNKLKTNT